MSPAESDINGGLRARPSTQTGDAGPPSSNPETRRSRSVPQDLLRISRLVCGPRRFEMPEIGAKNQPRTSRDKQLVESGEIRRRHRVGSPRGRRFAAARPPRGVHAASAEAQHRRSQQPHQAHQPAVAGPEAVGAQFPDLQPQPNRARIEHIAHMSRVHLHDHRPRQEHRGGRTGPGCNDDDRRRAERRQRCDEPIRHRCPVDPSRSALQGQAHHKTRGIAQLRR